MEREGNGGSEQSSSSDAGQDLALRKMMEEIIEPIVLNTCRQLMKPMIISTVHQVMEPVAEDLFRRVLKEEMQAVEVKLSTGGSRVDGNDMPKERILQLKFLDEVAGPVQTGKELKGTKDDPLKVALFDETDHIVTCGPESSVKVEIVLLDASGSDESILTHGNFERKIIGEEDKEKPHFAKNVYIMLDKGVGYLTGLKLGHGKDWTRLCYCRLGVRIVQNVRGTVVQEAWTAPFKVEDKRGKQYEKHDPPSLLSEVWRLDKIGRDGEPCKRLKKENIKTVQDFRFWLSVDPEGLQRILRAGDITWQTIVAHAHTSIIDDKKMYSYKSLTEPLSLSVIYNTVGELKGIIHQCQFVPIDNLSADKKDLARKLLRSVLECSAFGERYKTIFKNESSLPEEVPVHYRASDISTSTNSSMQQSLNVSDFTPSGNISLYHPTEPGSSSKSTDPSNLYDPGPSVSLGSKDMGDLSGPFPDSENIDGGIPLYDYETPSLLGDVSQLVNISKDGEIHKCLRLSKINTVEEFLIELLKDHEKLRQIVNLEKQEWEDTVSNARAFASNSKMYCYIDLEQKKGVIFDILGCVLGLCLENYCFPTSVLSETQMADAQELLASSCKNWSHVKPFNDVNDLQHLTDSQPTHTDPPDSLHQNNTVASEVVGESSSRRSNASFHSVTSTMDYRGYGDDYWDKFLDCRSPSPNLMHYYAADDTYSYYTDQIYDGLGEDAEPLQSSSNPPKGMKRLLRLFSSFKEKMSLDHKKPKVG